MPERITRIEAERAELIFEIEAALWEGKAVDNLVRRLHAFEALRQTHLSGEEEITARAQEGT
ncbi:MULTISPECIES: hypothetical protein [unclassified Bradyrhizobium]